MKRRMIFTYILFSMLLVQTVFMVNAESNDPTDVLQRIASAQREISYVGKRMLISWTPAGCAVREELIAHQPPSIHFVKQLMQRRDGTPMMRYRGRRDSERRRRGRRSDSSGRRGFSGRLFPSRPQELLSHKDLDLLVKNYDVTLSELSEEVVGYETDLLTIKPRFDHRPTRRIWVAKDQGVILRLEDFDANGNLRFMSVYTQISFQPERVKDALSEIPKKKEPHDDQKRGRHVSISEAQKVFGKSLIQPSYLPEGFELQSVRLMPFGPKPTVHLQYTDGLMGFSLFESQAPPFRDRPHNLRTQTKQIHGTPVQIMDRHEIRILWWSQEKVGLTLIGELNQSEMLKIVESLIHGSAQ
ncbi:DUF4367 domain-containing protein [Candidatus Poribacteria bacterium]|nr:DUF4367 domain-containing protein [Candidatus Poribacteria bacterium]